MCELSAVAIHKRYFSNVADFVYVYNFNFGIVPVLKIICFID